MKVAINMKLTYFASSNLCSFGVHAKWVPGTLNDVINIVTQRNRKTVPASAKNLRSSTILESIIYKVLVLCSL